MPEVRIAAHDVCDFCSDPKPVRLFQAPDFMMAKDSPGLRSRGGWMACAECGALIDAEQWKELVERAIAALWPKYDGLLPRRLLREQVELSHKLFREHMRRDA